MQNHLRTLKKCLGPGSKFLEKYEQVVFYKPKSSVKIKVPATNRDRATNMENPNLHWVQINCPRIFLPFFTNAKKKQFLVGGFNPFEKYAKSNWIISPKQGLKLKKIETTIKVCVFHTWHTWHMDHRSISLSKVIPLSQPCTPQTCVPPVDGSMVRWIEFPYLQGFRWDFSYQFQ